MNADLLELEELYEDLGLIGIRTTPDQNIYKLMTQSHKLVAEVDLDYGDYELGEGFLESLSKSEQYRLIKYLYVDMMG